MLKTINPKKVMLGIPTYGYEYQVSWTNGVTTYQRVRSFTFQEAMDRADLVGIAPTRDNADELSYAYQTSTYVSAISATLTSYISSTKPQASRRSLDAAPGERHEYASSFPSAMPNRRRTRSTSRKNMGSVG